MRSYFVMTLAAILMQSAPAVLKRDRPNFSGTWVYDSGPLKQGIGFIVAGSELRITQTSQELTIERVYRDAPSTAKIALDQTESKNKLRLQRGASTIVADLSTKAFWTPQDRLELSSTVEPIGEESIRVIELVWTEGDRLFIQLTEPYLGGRVPQATTVSVFRKKL